MSKPTLIEINKAQVALYQVKEVRSVIVNIMIKAGSWHEEGASWGAFHLLEHMMFQGCKNLENHEKIEIFKQENGINGNGGTSGKNTTYWFKFPDISTDQSLNFIENFIFNPLLPENEFNKEVSVIEQEYTGKWDNPSARFDRIIYQNLFGKDHVFQRDGLGQPEFIKTLNQSDLKKIHQDYYQPQNMIISVVGNFDKENIEKKLSSILNRHSNTSINNLKDESNWPVVQPQKQQINYQDKVNQSYLVIDWFLSKNKTFDIKTKFGLRMLSYILGGGPNSILFKKIRQELGLVYGISSQSWHYPKTHIFEIWASVDNKNLTTLIENIKNTLNDFLNNPIDKEVFERTRHYMDLQTLMSSDSINSISGSLIDDIFHYNQIYSPEEKIKIAKSIKPEDIRQLLKDHLDWKDAYINIMTPTQSKPE